MNETRDILDGQLCEIAQTINEIKQAIIVPPYKAHDHDPAIHGYSVTDLLGQIRDVLTKV